MTLRSALPLLWLLFLLGCGGGQPSSSGPGSPAQVESTSETGAAGTDSEQGTPARLEAFMNLVSRDEELVESGLSEIERHWHPGQLAMLLELHRFVWDAPHGKRTMAILDSHSITETKGDHRALEREIWHGPYQPHPQYAEFKAQLYSKIDPRFAEYFQSTANATIRLDEIQWGGVERDGIPPLKDPLMIAADEASYLADTDVVFGIIVDDDARAYPKRILAWHEMVKDVIGGVSLNGVYCTLCGSMIVYRTEFNGKHYELGTSGFLYRSNKLMYDHETKSLWSTLEGEPSVGPLVGQGIRLQPYHVVTTTWGEWRRRHPQTKVLSLNTGHSRNYREGAAYHEYFATDELMFRVPRLDPRLKNKDEVFIVRVGDDRQLPLAISLEFLKTHPVYHDQLGDERFVIVTDRTGANRAYSCGDVKFEQVDSDGLLDTSGRRWSIDEKQLTLSDSAQTCPRLPAHRAFWFGWQAAHPDTRLVK